MAKRSLGLALGSNLDNRIANLRAAVEGVLRFCDDKSLLTSSVYETEPVGCPEGSEPFYNAVFQVRCELEPQEVLEKCQAIELELGRSADRDSNAPRTIDIDLLYYGDHQISEGELVLPHPRLEERKFVLVPLNEIRPGLILPGRKLSIEEILDALETDESDPSPVFPRDTWL